MTELELEGELEGEEEWEEEYEGELEGEYEAEEEGEEFLGPIGPLAKGIGGLLGEEEYEGEWEEEYEGEWEEEGEYEANPLLRAYPDALMEHLGHAAAEAESEAEAEAFIGALVPLAAKLIPKVAPAIMKAAPKMISQAAKVTRVLRKSPVTKPLVRAVPNIVKRTTQSLASQAAHGKRITPQSALRTLERQTLRVLRNPTARQRAIRHSRVVDRRFHRLPATARGRLTAGARVPVRRGSGVRYGGRYRPRLRYRPGYQRPGARYRPRMRYRRPGAWGGYAGAAPAAAAPAAAAAGAPPGVGYGYGGYGAPGPAMGPMYGGPGYGGFCECCGQPL